MKLERKLFTSIRKVKKVMWDASRKDAFGNFSNKLKKDAETATKFMIKNSDKPGTRKVLTSNFNKAIKVNKKLGYPTSFIEDNKKSIVDNMIKSMKEQRKFSSVELDEEDIKFLEEHARNKKGMLEI